MTFPGIPNVTVTQQPEETLTFADGTTVTRKSVRVNDDGVTLFMNNYLITSPGGNGISVPHLYSEDR